MNKLTNKSFIQITENLPQIIWLAKPDGTIIYYNKEWYAYTLSKKTDEQNWNEYVHKEDIPRILSLWDKIKNAGKPYKSDYRLLNGKTKQYEWFSSNCIPIKSDSGEIINWLGTSANINKQKKALEYQNLLLNASKILSSSVDYKTTLKHIAKVCVPDIADWFAIDLQKEDSLELIAVAHRDPKKVKWAKKLRKESPPILDKNSGYGKILRTGKPEIYPLITDKMMRLSAKNKHEYKIMKKIGFCSVMFVPLIINSKAIGIITYVSSESKRTYTQYDLKIAQELAVRISLAIQNAKLFTELKKSQTQIKSLVDANILGVVYCDLNGKIYEANTAFMNILGYSEKEFDKNKINLKQITPIEYKQIDSKKSKELINFGTAQPWEKEYIKKDGSRANVILGASLINENTNEIIAFVLDISERKLLDARKDEFISIASHELKTPLTSIKGYIQLLERSIVNLENTKLKQYLHKTNTYVDKLDTLIVDLLDVSKIQAGKLLLEISEFDINDLILSSIEGSLHATNNHEIIFRPVKPVIIKADKHRLEQVITNLISNAVKYSPNSNKINIKVKKNNKNVIVSVQDYGIGISLREQKHLFERFYRVSSAAKKFSGLGIGLYICAEIIKRHNGKIGVVSKVKKGSTFYFELPL